MRQFINKPNGINNNRGLSVRQRKAATGRIKRGKERIFDKNTGLSQSIHQS